MKGFLLAAGNGTRLRPITNNIPKCLVPIQGRPLIDYWIDKFKQYNVNEILINLHYLPNKVADHLKKSNTNIAFTCIYEKELLGSAGTIVENKDFIKDEELFWVFYSDVLININLDEMKKYHIEKGADITIAVHQTSTPESCGVVQINSEGQVIKFEEKPQKPLSNLANSGVYLINTKAIEYFPSTKPLDFGYDILANNDIKIYAYQFRDYIRDIGTIESYIMANKELRLRRNQYGNFTDAPKS